MKKVSFLFSVAMTIGFSFSMYGQSVEFDDSKFQANKLTKASMAFKPIPLESAQSEQLDVTGWGAPSYIISNVASGLASSYEHSYRVSYPLTVAGNKSGYSLVFYGPHDKIPYSVEVENGKTTFYVPFSLHDNFKSKFEQAITLRKKVTVNLKLETNGYREASWKFN
jgi:hypothetical protein